MEMLAAVIHGFVLALGLILPLGVQNVFVFNQGAVQPHLAKALPVVITASLCDTFLILLAVFGVSVMILGSYWLKTLLLGLGILFLLYMGWVTWRAQPNLKGEAKGEAAKAFPPKKQIAFAASVSLLNPHAIMDTVGVIGTSSLRYAGAEKAAFTIACIVVSWLWFTGLAFAGKMIGNLDKSGRFMVLLNKFSALIMWGTALFLAFSLVESTP